MRNDTKTFASQVDSREYLDFDGKLFVSYDYWRAQMIDRAFAEKWPQPKVEKPEKLVFGRRAV